jgi:hypothetical protein
MQKDLYWWSNPMTVNIRLNSIGLLVMGLHVGCLYLSGIIMSDSLGSAGCLWLRLLRFRSGRHKEGGELSVQRGPLSKLVLVSRSIREQLCVKVCLDWVPGLGWEEQLHRVPLRTWCWCDATPVTVYCFHPSMTDYRYSNYTRNLVDRCLRNRLLSGSSVRFTIRSFGCALRRALYWEL